jgi:hypothetical protein
MNELKTKGVDLSNAFSPSSHSKRPCVTACVRLPGPTRQQLAPQAAVKLPSIQTPFLKTERKLASRHSRSHHASDTPVTMFSRQALLRSARTAAPQRAILGQTRAFAAPAASSERVQPPVALFGLDGTYATALVRPPPDRPIALPEQPLEGVALEDA